MSALSAVNLLFRAVLKLWLFDEPTSGNIGSVRSNA
jgi:hypothetical protein